MEAKHRMSTRSKAYLASIMEASIQARIEASIEPRHGSLEARCGRIEEASISFLEDDEEGCVETRGDPAEGELEKTRLMAKTSDLKQQ